MPWRFVDTSEASCKKLYNCGADRGIRTHDPLFTKQPL